VVGAAGGATSAEDVATAFDLDMALDPAKGVAASLDAANGPRVAAARWGS
jgi:hypothetical protein